MRRKRPNKELVASVAMPRTNFTCTVPGCVRPAKVRGHCGSHYWRLSRKGSVLADQPLGSLPRVWVQDVELRFWRKVRCAQDVNVCWEWTAAHDDKGYGTFWSGTGLMKAHRWAYKHWVGPVADHLHLDHLCRNTSCVNPAHLEPVTMAENLRRGKKPYSDYANRTHCRHGHEWNDGNTFVNPRGHRECLVCSRGRYHKKKAQVPA